MRLLRFSLITCIVLGISAAFVDSANAGFNFKAGINDGSVVDRHTLWATSAGGSIKLTDDVEWTAAKAFIDGGGVAELGVYFIVDSLRADGSEYYSLDDAGELTGVMWGMEVAAMSSFTIGLAKFYTIELAVADDIGAQFRMYFEDSPEASPFNGFLDPAINRDALAAAGQPYDASGAIESGAALLDGEIIGDSLTGDGKFIVITVQVLDGGGTVIDGISGSTTVFVDVHGDAGGLDGTFDHLIAPGGQGGPGQDIELNARFFFNGSSPTLVAGFGSPQNVTGVSTDPFIFTVIPEPSSFALFGIGVPFLLGMAIRRRKKNKATA